MLQFPRSPLCARALAIFIASGSMVMAAATQQPPVAQDPPSAPAPSVPPEMAEAGIREQLARELTRLALLDLRAVPTPGDADYQVTSIVLGIAHELHPASEDILRRYIEAAYSAGDEALVLELTRRLLAPDMAPDDTVAQLRLISASVSRRNQTAEERLARYDEFLGPRGRAFDPAIRSRLALDAALLLRERGDERGFLEKLTLATQLDPTHKEAAALAATVIAESGQGPRATLEGLSLLLMADPVDPNIHLAIARLLASSHAFESAQRFHRNTLAIMQAAGDVPDDVLIEGRVLDWHVSGPGELVRQFNQDLLFAQDAAARAIRAQQEAGNPVDGMRKPEDIHLPLNITGIAAAAAQASGDETAARSLLRDMATEASRIVQRIEESVHRGEADQQQAAEAIVSTVLQVQTARLWVGHHIENAARDLESNIDVFRQASPEALEILRGWLAVRLGSEQDGLKILEPFAENHLFARLGMATAHEALGDVELARSVYLQILNEAPLNSAGAWAKSRLLALGHEVDLGQAAALERLARTIPAAIDQMVVSPRTFIQLTARELDSSPEALHGQYIRLRIKNVSRFPLALGADRAINSRMLVAPKLDVDGQSAAHLIRPEVIDLDRRLRLMPMEMLEVDIWADPGSTGWLLDVLSNRTMRNRWRIVQGFVLDQQVGFRPGPMSQIAETGSIDRRPLPQASLTPDMLAQRVAGDPAGSLPRLAAAVRARLVQPLIAPAKRDFEEVPGLPGEPKRFMLRIDDMEALAPVINEFAARFPDLRPVERAVIAAILPHGTMTPFMNEFDQVVRADTDPLVMAVTLMTRVTSPDDEYISRARESGDQRLVALAEAVAERLKGETQFYSRTAPGRRNAPVNQGEAPR